MQNEPHILFVDDDLDTRELMACMLGCSGFRVSVVGSSLEASKLAATECFDAMVLDNWMPELNGVELCKRIKTYDQEIPVIFCSGAVTRQDVLAAAKVGAQAYLAKPIDTDELIRVLHNAIDARRKRLKFFHSSVTNLEKFTPHDVPIRVRR
jgi:CheY-like chemotaxis protein